MDTNEIEERKDNVEGSELSNLIINILDYYSFKQKVEDDSDTWKKDTTYESEELIPKDIDEKIKELFLETIVNMIDEEKKKRKKK